MNTPAGHREVNSSDPVRYSPVFYSPSIADDVFNELLSLDWEKRPDAPRREYWCNDFGQPYTYGRGRGQRTYQARPIPKRVHSARMGMAAYGMGYFEGCFLNLYEDDRQALGWHADDDPGIDHTRPIVVITLGQPRVIQFKRQDGTGDVAGVLLGHGSIFTMLPGMQQTHFHRIPKASFRADARISMTFRGLVRHGKDHGHDVDERSTQTDAEDPTGSGP